MALQAETMKTQMDKLTPGQMKYMMRAAAWLQTAVGWYKLTVQFILSRTFLMVALAILVVAIVLRFFDLL